MIKVVNTAVRMPICGDQLTFLLTYNGSFHIYLTISTYTKFLSLVGWIPPRDFSEGALGHPTLLATPDTYFLTHSHGFSIISGGQNVWAEWGAITCRRLLVYTYPPSLYMLTAAADGASHY